MSFQSWLANQTYAVRFRRRPGDTAPREGYAGWAGEEQRAVPYKLLDRRLAQEVGAGGGYSFYAPFVYAQMLQDEARAGGTLSDLHTQRSYQTAVQGILNQERLRVNELPQSLQQAGFSQGTALSILRDNPIRMQRELSALRGQAEREHEENIYGAKEALTNVIKNAERDQAQISAGFKSLSAAEDASRRQQQTDIATAAIAGTASYLGNSGIGL